MVITELRKAYKNELQVEVSYNWWDLQQRHNVIPDMDRWCCETFGDPGRNNNKRWRRSHLYHRTDKLYWKYYFKHEEDATWFLLKWKHDSE